MSLTKSQKEILNLLKNDSTYYISYDNVMARAGLWKERERIKTIPFNSYLVIAKFLRKKKEQPYGSIVFYEFNSDMKELI